MPSAVLLSILVHVALFLLAGMLVVFTVVKKEEQKFEPPKAVERPKMKLKKPKVKIKKTSRPKPTTRIVTKVNRASMPDIQLPEMSGIGDGLGGDFGGFDLMPDLGEPTLFGSSQSIGNDFVGTYYDTKFDRSGKVGNFDWYGAHWYEVFRKFLRGGWDTQFFARYYRSPKKLYATHFVVPVTWSYFAPIAFGEKDDNASGGGFWMTHYTGKLVCPASHTNGITFRFWGVADTLLYVRVDGRPSLYWDWPNPEHGLFGTIATGMLWDSSSADSLKYRLGNGWAGVGDWITLKPGDQLDMEVIFGDNGGAMSCYLLVEEEGVEYERNRQGAPILPIFKTDELSHDELDLIYKDIAEGEMVCLTNGPVFCDYDTSPRAVAPKVEEPEPVVPKGSRESKMRTWTLAGGRTLEAEFVNIFAGKVVLKDAKGKIRKVSKERLSAEAVEYVELACPPTLEVNFLNNFDRMEFSNTRFYYYGRRHPEERGHYGIQLRQISAGEYNHALKVELFAIGQQEGGRSTHLLLDRQETTFNPAEEEQRTYEFRSPREVVLRNFDDYYKNIDRGEKYASYLVVVTDERGEVVAVKSPKKWLVDNLDNLRKLSIGNFMDKNCLRTYPEKLKKSQFF